jgi:hypothetical protein
MPYIPSKIERIFLFFTSSMLFLVLRMHCLTANKQIKFVFTGIFPDRGKKKVSHIII